MARKMNCTHPEGRDQDGLPLKHDDHDCDYVDARNALIPKAERIASQEAVRLVPEGSVGLELRRDAAWNRAFHAAMDALAAENGLTGRPVKPQPVPEQPRFDA